ncbi:MAG: hypothetical protein HY847_18815 [Betaproteobacteria bacterium]|nr:hypothetical protein [Betaproteobacteria bacterium]
MKETLKLCLGIAAAALLTACGSTDSASYQIHGAQHSLSLIRNRQFAWDKGWEISLVAARNPECMRRHKLQPAPEGAFTAELFRSLEGNYILKQGNNWYVTETQKCQLQQFKQSPREPGDALGTFNEKDGLLQFVAAPKPPAAAPVTAPVAAPAAAPAAGSATAAR